MRLKITLITSSHLSSNPRLVKEAKALLNAGYELHILCAQILKELSEFDKNVFQELSGANIHIIDYQTNNLKGYYLRIKSAIRLKASTIKFFKFLSKSQWITLSRMLPEMKIALKHIKTDLYIGHTLAALPAAAWAASFHKSKYAFDAEDFHSGETNNFVQQQLIISFENEFLTGCSYLSTASPLSTELYRDRYPELKIITINNVFSFNNSRSQKTLTSKPIKLVWFSQTIGLNRGLQDFFVAMEHLDPNSFELHLRGSYTPEIRNELLKSIHRKWHSNVFFYQQCGPSDLDKWLNNFDIGLALESDDTLNRDICITNKVFQYISAGLAIITTDTRGQKWVLNRAPNIGILISKNKIELTASHLKYWSENLEQLKEVKQSTIIAAQTTFNWDLEKNKLLNQISLIRSKN